MDLKKRRKYQDFKNINVSTKTYTTSTNLELNLDKLFEFLPITPYEVVIPKRGRKKKGEVINKNQSIAEGSIITIKSAGRLKGVLLKKPSKSKLKQQSNKEGFFRNSITIVIILDKIINFKISRNGTFQMTGCKTHRQAERCVETIWELIKSQDDIWSLSSGNTLSVMYIPCMRNIDFSLGFTIDREKLNNYIKTNTSKIIDKVNEYLGTEGKHDDRYFHSLLETLFGYTGVNIKLPLTQDISTMKINKKEFVNDSWVSCSTTYNEYLTGLTEKDRNIKLNKERFFTFLVFHSGKVIMSGLTAEFMEDVYYLFIEIIDEAFEYIEERLFID